MGSVVTPRRRGTSGAMALMLILAATAGTLALGAVVKEPCAAGTWQDGRQYRRLCYSDIVPLYGAERLTGHRLPYLDSCPGQENGTCDEYPVLTMYFMRLAAWVSKGYGAFFRTNTVLLGLCALISSFLLSRMTGERALMFALAPSLLLLSFVNWDLLAVAITTGATFAYLRGRDRGGGILLGLGAAAKLYPALLVIPFAVGRLRARRSADAARLMVWSAVSYAAVNFPFALLGTKGWWTFFKANANRTLDFDSIWFVACRKIEGGGVNFCPWSPHLMDIVSLAAIVASVAGVWWLRGLRDPGFPAWTLGFPVIALFLLFNKVYSPQYSLWLLPWFALALPDVRLFVAFELADVAVFVTRFSWFGTMAAGAGDPAFAGFHGASLGAFQTALVVRALILAACVVAWVIRSGEREEEAQTEALRPLLAEAG